jgi:hypothetical protein
VLKSRGYVRLDILLGEHAEGLFGIEYASKIQYITQNGSGNVGIKKAESK